ncbi:MAG TPA: DUF3365 domain-containing protein [Flavobacteriaceae bacterium]|nr:DUF3365 domain-containing protein [Flavobacteriaceae bacterium]
MKQLLIISALAITFFSCKDSENKQYSALDLQLQANNHPGKKAMEKYCYVCHSPTASHDDRIAPPMVAIKKHYIDSDTSKEDFVAAMQAWIKNPNKEDAKMFGAVKRFGVMPKQSFPEEDIKQIAEYMFDFDIEQPEWFEDHFKEEQGKHKGQGMGNGKGKGKGMGQGMHKQQAEVNFEDLPYDERGLKYALTTKAVLGKNLMGTIQKKGTLEALAFCNEKAYPLTDSMSVVHNANIKRVSDKPRNPNNKASLIELDYIKTFKKQLENQEDISPIVKEGADQVHVYYPIVTNSMCLQCHGKPNENIKPEIIKKLTLLYPEDQATGYKTDQVRGIWSIAFDN